MCAIIIIIINIITAGLQHVSQEVSGYTSDMLRHICGANLMWANGYVGRCTMARCGPNTYVEYANQAIS